jgi:hypothetical protein
MSLVPTYVQSKEGSWYENPEVSGDGWFICWDDDEPIELVIEIGKTNVTKVLSSLRRQGWDLIVITSNQKGQRMFAGEFRPANAFFLKQVKNGPPEHILAGVSLGKKRPTRDGTYYFNGPNGHDR